jgi:hypothetical protein
MIVAGAISSICHRQKSKYLNDVPWRRLNPFNALPDKLDQRLIN